MYTAEKKNVGNVLSDLDIPLILGIFLYRVKQLQLIILVLNVLSKKLESGS